MFFLIYFIISIKEAKTVVMKGDYFCIIFINLMLLVFKEFFSEHKKSFYMLDSFELIAAQIIMLNLKKDNKPVILIIMLE